MPSFPLTADTSVVPMPAYSGFLAAASRMARLAREAAAAMADRCV